jgi:prolipoprotein diacylglyceryltransferase/protein-S-isoprenylcysteine O-methyltransferase Ste14
MTHASQTIGLPTGVSLRAAGTVAAYAGIFFVVLPGLLWTLGGRLDALLLLLPVRGVLVRWAGAAAFLFGTVWMAWAMWLLWRTGRGLPISHLPPVRLTTGGPYAVTRHPIYVGYVATFAGAGAVAGSVGRSVIVAALLALGSVIYALGFEEERLERRFGALWAAYRRTTPAFPVPLPAPLRSALVTLWRHCRPRIERIANRVVLVRVRATTWVTYGVFAAAGAAVISTWIAAALAGAGLSPVLIGWCLVGLAVATPVGSRAMWLAYRVDQLRADPRGTLRQVGFVSWGGILGLFGCATAFGWLAHLDVLRLLDAVAVGGLAGQAVARVGCFTYGCCYGRPSALGIRWTDPEAKPVREHGAAGMVPRVPTQLLSSAAAAALFATMLVVLRRGGAAPGTVTGLAFLGYGVVRFGIECLRADPRFGTWRLTQGQVGCVVITCVGLALLLVVPATPRPALALDFAAVLPLTPILALCAALVLGVYGFHRRQVGRW